MYYCHISESPDLHQGCLKLPVSVSDVFKQVRQLKDLPPRQTLGQLVEFQDGSVQEER